MPHDMRIKPKSGFMEVDVKLNTNHNFNKYHGLKWGDATAASKQLHNASGTYGPAAGLAPPRQRTRGGAAAIKDPAQRDIDLETSLQSFKEAESDHKVHNSQTLGGQIIRHDEEELKPHYFVGAFQGDQLHLTKIDGTVMMRPNFHHLDANDSLTRPPPPPPPTVPKQMVQTAKNVSSETKSNDEKLKDILREASEERWIRVNYIDDEDPVAYENFETKLKIAEDKIKDTPHLKTQMDNDAFLDAISLPREGSPQKRRKRTTRRKSVTAGRDSMTAGREEHIDISDEDDDEGA